MGVVGKRKRYTTMNRWLYESRPVFFTVCAVYLLKFTDIGTSPVGRASGVVLLGAAVYTFYLRYQHRNNSRSRR